MLYDIYLYSQGDIERQEFYYFSPLCFKKPICFLMRKKYKDVDLGGQESWEDLGELEEWKNNPNIMYEN